MVDKSVVTGPELDAIVAQAKEWYFKERAFLIEAMLSGGYPYGATPLTPAQQFAKFQRMQPQDWLQLRATLMNIWKGDPNALQNTEQALNSYSQQMAHYGR